MTQVIADMAMSIDGFVADPDDRTDALFGWYFGGDVEVPTGTPGFRLPHQRGEREGAARGDRERRRDRRRPALLRPRRRLGRPPPDERARRSSSRTSRRPRCPASRARSNFVTDGVESAIAQAKAAAGDRWVAVATPTIVRQCLDAGLLDTLSVNLVPVVMGTGVPFFAELARSPVRLSDPVVYRGRRRHAPALRRQLKHRGGARGPSGGRRRLLAHRRAARGPRGSRTAARVAAEAAGSTPVGRASMSTGDLPHHHRGVGRRADYAPTGADTRHRPVRDVEANACASTARTTCPTGPRR